MSGVRVLVGTRKGAFVLTADGARREWEVRGPFFPGLEVYHLDASPADPNRIWAAPSSGWFGQQIHRSDDGGRQLAADGQRLRLRRRTRHPPVVRRHPAPVGVRPGVAPGAVGDDPDTVLAGVEDAALFRSIDGGRTWAELPGLREHGSAPHWQPGAGRHVPAHDPARPARPDRMLVAISAAGVFRTDDGGKSWRAIQLGPGQRRHPGPGRRRRALRAQAGPPPGPAGHASTCRSTGT